MPGDVWAAHLDNERFNAGVLSLEPTVSIHEKLIAAHGNHTASESFGSTEQATF